MLVQNSTLGLGRNQGWWALADKRAPALGTPPLLLSPLLICFEWIWAWVGVKNAFQNLKDKNASLQAEKWQGIPWKTKYFITTIHLDVAFKNKHSSSSCAANHRCFCSGTWQLCHFMSSRPSSCQNSRMKKKKITNNAFLPSEKEESRTLIIALNLSSNIHNESS